MRKELREKYRIPNEKVLSDLFAEKEPKWNEDLKKEAWWQRDNLKKIEISLLDEKSADMISSFKRLNEIMLEIGGSETSFNEWSENYKKLLERGYYREGKSKMKKGQPCQCHYNVARLFDESIEDDDIVICTGFALSDDGMWRSHSWALQKYISRTGKLKTRLIETTAKRVAYFGFELSSVEANEFAEFNS